MKQAERKSVLEAERAQAAAQTDALEPQDILEDTDDESAEVSASLLAK